ncbi:hypothetical protein Bbelb_378270 [Branchiostoma belcheri]|nr:hypothetical protein Bbelb_378270 [Branchiostoma belcheri]
MGKEQASVMTFLLVILKVFGPTEAPCITDYVCKYDNQRLTSVPQDLPTPHHGDILVCEASGIPTPDITVTLPSGLNKTVQSGGRVTVGANSTIIINVTADAAGLYVCTATNPAGSTFASLFVYARQENPKTLEPGLEKLTNLTLEPQLDKLRNFTFEPELDKPTSRTLEPALTSSPALTIIRISGKPENSNGPTDSNSNGCTATDNTDNVTASQGPTDPNSNGCTATDNVTASQDQTVLVSTQVSHCSNHVQTVERSLSSTPAKSATSSASIRHRSPVSLTE